MIGYFRNMLPGFRFAFLLMVIGAGVLAYSAGKSQGLWYGVGFAGVEILIMAFIVTISEIASNS